MKNDRACMVSVYALDTVLCFKLQTKRSRGSGGRRHSWNSSRNPDARRNQPDTGPTLCYVGILSALHGRLQGDNLMIRFIMGCIVGFVTPFVIRFREDIMIEMKEYLKIGRKKQN